MKKLFLFFILLTPVTAFAKINVVATLPVFASLAREIGGDRADVSSLARPGQDPHFLDAKPTFVVSLSHADVLLHGGLDLEIGWLPALVVQSRNAKILANAPGNVDLSRGLDILEIPSGTVDRSMGDIHTKGNPHAWLDPRNAKIMAATIARALTDADPTGQFDYDGRLKKFISDLDQKLTEWQARSAALRGLKIVTYHKSLSYLAHWLGLDVVATIEPKPGIPPSSRYVDQLLDTLPGSGAGLILMENYYAKKVPEYVSQKTGLPLAIVSLDPGETVPYAQLIEPLITALEKAKK